MQLIKLLLNAVVSDIKDFYLGTPLPNTEYMRINLNHIPEDVIQKHNMREFEHHGAVIVERDTTGRRETQQPRT